MSHDVIWHSLHTVWKWWKPLQPKSSN